MDPGFPEDQKILFSRSPWSFSSELAWRARLFFISFIFHYKFGWWRLSTWAPSLYSRFYKCSELYLMFWSSSLVQAFINTGPECSNGDSFALVVKKLDNTSSGWCLFVITRNHSKIILKKELSPGWLLCYLPHLQHSSTHVVVYRYINSFPFRKGPDWHERPYDCKTFPVRFVLCQSSLMKHSWIVVYGLWWSSRLLL